MVDSRQTEARGMACEKGCKSGMHNRSPTNLQGPSFLFRDAPANLPSTTSTPASNYGIRGRHIGRAYQHYVAQTRAGGGRPRRAAELLTARLKTRKEAREQPQQEQEQAASERAHRPNLGPEIRLL